MTEQERKLVVFLFSGFTPPDAGIFIFKLGKANALNDNGIRLKRDLLRRHAARSRLSRLD